MLTKYGNLVESSLHSAYLSSRIQPTCTRTNSERGGGTHERVSNGTRHEPEKNIEELVRFHDLTTKNR
jgi:hypothetical protein